MTTKLTDADELIRLRKLLHKARNRERYWSGRPSFSAARYRPSTTRRHRDLEHEQALDDIANLKRQINELKEPKQ